MKRWIPIFGSSALILAALGGCAKQPPAEIQNARAAYNRAASGPALQSNRAGVLEAREALRVAEEKQGASPGSANAKTAGYVAQRKAEIAEVDGRTAMARSQQDRAEKALLKLQVVQSRRDAEQQRQAAETSERRAKVALDQLGLAAKTESRGTVITLTGESMFATDKAEILDSAKRRLNEIANGIKDALSQNQAQDVGRRIQLIGYTDDSGSEQHNLDLSRRRAEAVRTYFSQRGLDASQMDVDGRGEDSPIADNTTKKGRAKNRRVEVVITPPASGVDMQRR